MRIQTLRNKRGVSTKASAALVKGGEIVVSTDTHELYAGVAAGDAEAQAVAVKLAAGNIIGVLGADKLPALTLNMMPVEVQSLIGSIEECGEWNADTGLISAKNADCPAGVPAVGQALPAAAAANKGWMFIVSTNGSTALDGITEWMAGDMVVSNGAKWRKNDNTPDTTYDCGELV